jgi:hypothetical protein
VQQDSLKKWAFKIKKISQLFFLVHYFMPLDFPLVGGGLGGGEEGWGRVKFFFGVFIS